MTCTHCTNHINPYVAEIKQSGHILDHCPQEKTYRSNINRGKMEIKKQELVQFSNFKQQDKLWISAAKAAYEAQLMRKHYQELEEKLLEELKKISDEPSIGGGFAFESITRKGTIDYKSIPQLKEIDLEKYRKESSISWKLYKV